MLRRPNPAVIGTVHPDGGPVTVATWYVWNDEDGTILVNMDAGRRRLEYLRRDPRASLTVLDDEDWGTHISVRGRLKLEDDPDFEVIDRIARHYTGNQYPVRDRPRVTGRLEIESWHGWGRFA